MKNNNTRRGFTLIELLDKNVGQVIPDVKLSGHALTYSGVSPSPLVGEGARRAGEGFPRGFTLVELLVVVLIIGILAAVALPQYQMTVMRARFAKLYNIARTYERAAQEYIAANGTWPSTFADLVIDAPGGMKSATPASSNCVKNQEFYCCISKAIETVQGSGITCGLADYSLAYFYEYRGSLGSQGAGKQCYAKQTNTVANKVCSSYGNSRNSLNLITPQGHQTGYYNYYMTSGF